MSKEYGLKPFFRISYTVNALLYFLIFFLKAQSRLFTWSSQWIGNILAIGFAIIAIMLLYNAFFEKLIISEAGIEHRAFLQHIFLPWEQTESIPTRFSSKILIAKPSKRTKSQGISLYLFADKPTESALGQQIKQYAPHLFVQEKENS